MTTRIGIVGAGIVGVALARHLAVRCGADVTVMEKENRVAAHQTGHNSGVVHAGLYYAPGSLKAELCAQGRAMMRDYCADKNLPYREVGKLVVAIDDSELNALDRIEQRSRANRVPDLRRVDAAGILEIEPAATGVAALHSPHTAVVDYAAITESLAQDVRIAGGTFLFGHEVTGVAQEQKTVRVSTPSNEVEVDRLIVCAGLQSDIVARLVGAPASPRILPFRGEYWSMSPKSERLIKGMIYPVPDPAFPFLGVHFTRGVYDNVHVGPNAVPALAREGYRWRDISLRDTIGSMTWPGALTLARRHWRMGSKEIIASVLKRRYFEDARRFVPELQMEDLAAKVAAGVRAQAWGRDGALLDDFAIDQIGAVTLLRNAPSPAATSAMAIAEHLTSHYLS